MYNGLFIILICSVVVLSTEISQIIVCSSVASRMLWGRGRLGLLSIWQ